jgi:hypothetical protein
MAGKFGYTLCCTFIFYQNKKLSKVSLSLQLVILGYLYKSLMCFTAILIAEVSLMCFTAILIEVLKGA